MAIRVIGRDEAMALTTPHHDLWLAAHEAAAKSWWGGVREHVPSLFVAGSASTRASTLHDLIVREVEVRGGSSISHSKGLGFFTQLITNGTTGVLVRFKMLDAAFMAQNHQSGQQDELDAQNLTSEMLEQLTLSGLPSSLTLLTCGYQLSTDEMSMSNLAVVCHRDHEVLYWYSLESNRDIRGVEVLPLRVPDGPPPGDVRSKRRKPEEPTLF